MKLQKGIRIQSLLEGGYNAFHINSGTEHHMERSLEDVDYHSLRFKPLFESDSYLPKEDWRPLSDGEIALIRADKKRKANNTIYTGDLPTDLANALKDLGVDDTKHRDEVMDLFRTQPDKVQAINAMMERFLSGIADGKPFHFHCIAANLPNLPSVACDITRLPQNFTVDQKRYIGLHNDGTQFMTVHSAYKLGNRITINLGKDERVFYFINLTLIQAFNMLKAKIDIREHPVTVHNISLYFLKYFPDYPVVRVLQQPYQYYIAPTDNCIHDGATLGNKFLDVNMVYFGAFKC